jgi:predicted membrane protein
MTRVVNKFLNKNINFQNALRDAQKFHPKDTSLRAKVEIYSNCDIIVASAHCARMKHFLLFFQSFRIFTTVSVCILSSLFSVVSFFSIRKHTTFSLVVLVYLFFIFYFKKKVYRKKGRQRRKKKLSEEASGERETLRLIN